MSAETGHAPVPRATLGDAVWRMFQGGSIRNEEKAMLRRTLRVLGGRRTAGTLLDVSKRLAVVPGEAVVTEGAKGSALYLVLDGCALVERNGQELARFRAGEFFGEMALLSGRARVATIRATERAIVLKIPSEAVDAKMRERLWTYAAYRYLGHVEPLPVAQGRPAERWFDTARHSVLPEGEWSVETPWLFLYAGSATIDGVDATAPALVRGGTVRCAAEIRMALLHEPE